MSRYPHRISTAAFFGLALACAQSAAQIPQPKADGCKLADEAELAGLFDRWNAALGTGDAGRVADLYGEDALLLPTLSDEPRADRAGKIDYFEHFLADRPQGRIDQRWTRATCNAAIDTGLYTFHFAATGERVSGRYSFSYEWDGARWLISSHHSSLLPED